MCTKVHAHAHVRQGATLMARGTGHVHTRGAPRGVEWQSHALSCPNAVTSSALTWPPSQGIVPSTATHCSSMVFTSTISSSSKLGVDTSAGTRVEEAATGGAPVDAWRLKP